jgi:hypothetical protein
MYNITLLLISKTLIQLHYGPPIKQENNKFQARDFKNLTELQCQLYDKYRSINMIFYIKCYMSIFIKIHI